MKKNSVLVTGGAGFIGSHFVDLAVAQGCKVTVLDKMTYAASRDNIAHHGHKVELVEGDICDGFLVEELIARVQPDAIVNFAAESHVDRSISSPDSFIQTNVVGTFNLLQQAQKYFAGSGRANFRFIHVSTDEVYGSLGAEGFFTEKTAYDPRSPYSASKAASDHLVKAWFHTYKLPTVVTNCSNNYGPRQFPEKLIPHMILSGLEGRKFPVYGKGENVRDWIHVEDHAQGVWLALNKGTPGETYLFGGRSERNNLQVVKGICGLLDELSPAAVKYESRIDFVTDRPGHDFRYAIDDTRAQNELGFERKYKNFEEGLRETVKWYLSNLTWCEHSLARVSGKVAFDWAALKGKL